MANPRISIYIPYPLSHLQLKALDVWLATICSQVENRRPYARRNQRHYDAVRDRRELFLLRLQLWQEETPHEHVRVALEKLQTAVNMKLHDYWFVGVTGGEQLGASYTITQGLRNFGVDVQAFQPHKWDADNTTTLEIESLLDGIGTLPYHCIEITALQERHEDLLLLAYMAADLCDDFEARARIILQPEFHTIRGSEEWTLADTRDLATSLDGTAIEIPFAVNRAGEVQRYHLADGDFMRSWVEHRRFALHP